MKVVHLVQRMLRSRREKSLLLQSLWGSTFQHISADQHNNESSCIARYPGLPGTSLTDLFTQTPSRLRWEASSHMLKLIREDRSYTYPPLSVARYSFIRLSELEQCRVNKLAQGFNTAAQVSNPGSRSRESEALPLSHCALHAVNHLK